MSSLDTIRESLQRRIDLISKLQNEGDLYLETCAYLNAIVSDQRTNPIVQSMIVDGNCLFEKYAELTNKVIERLTNVANSIKELLSSVLDSKAITNLFSDFDGFLNGSHHVGGQKWASLEYSLKTICLNVKDLPIKTDGIFTIKNNSVRFNYTDEKLLMQWHEKWEIIQIEEQTSVWGAWNRLVRVYRALNGTKSQCHKAMQKNVFSGSDFVKDVNEMKLIIANSSALKHLSLIPESTNDHFNRKLVRIDLERLHNFILDRLNRTSLGLALLTKYKRRCEWYDLDDLLTATKETDEKKRDAAEEKFTANLCKFLLDNNVLPLSEVTLKKSRPDILIQSKEEVFPIEVKIVRLNENTRVKMGFNQIKTYIRTLNASEGFYVIFCRGDFALSIPPTISEDSFRINIVTIDLLETSPSTKNRKLWKISKRDLLS